MTEMTDADVFGAPKEMTDADVFGKPEAPTYGNVSESIPEAFLDRVRAGQALSRIISAAGHEAKEGAAGSTPTGFSDETLNGLIDVGVFHDPLKSRPGPIQMANEAVLLPAAQIWQSITGAINAGIHGAGGAVGQIVEEFGGSQGTGNRAKNEVINAGNWAMIEGGMGRFSRPQVEPGMGVTERVVGGLPVEADFVNAAKVLAPETSRKPAPIPEGFNALPISDVIQRGAAEESPFIAADGQIIGTGGDHLSLYNPAEQRKANALRATVYRDKEGKLTTYVEARDGQSVTAEQIDTLRQLTAEPNSRFAFAIKKGDEFGIANSSKSATLDEFIEATKASPQSGNHVEQNLRRMWKEDGITPAEAVHDAQSDAFLRHDITAPRVEIDLRPKDEIAPTEKPVDLFRIDQNDFHSLVEERIKLATIEGNIAEGKPLMHLFGRDPNGKWGSYYASHNMGELEHEWALSKRHEPQRDWVVAETSAKSVAEENSQIDQIIQNLEYSDRTRAAPAEQKPIEALRLTHDEYDALTETGGRPGSLSAAMTEPGDIPLDVQPASRPGSLIASAQQSANKLFDVGHDIQMKLAPMARGTMESMATVKDYMNSMRRNAWDSSRIDTDTLKRFPAEDRARMANAMEEESLSLRLGEQESAREHQGLSTLTPEARDYIVEQDARQQLAWLRARDLGMVEGEGVPMHFPRMVTGIPKGLDKSGDGMVSLTAIGYDLRSGTPYLKQRKHLELEDTERAVKEKIGMQLALQGKSVDEIGVALEKVKVVRDIRAVNLATKQLEDAVAGRQLIENIKEVGKRTGIEAVAEGFRPDDSWFTVDHPAFKTWRPKFEEVEGKIQAVVGADGKPIFEQVPIYVHGEFEGPLRSALWGKSSESYQAMMALKGKTMSYVMNSPMIHNMVEWGRALAAAPFEVGSLRIYFTGNRAKHDVATMHEAIGHGLVPIGKRFFNQDINALMEEPSLTPGRSIEAQAAAFIPGLFDEAAGTAVKQAIDKAGDFWHNTMLWDRIADLQAGLYVHLRDAKIASGMDRDTASYMAARWANQYAGALPKEAMSEAATKISNFMLFSRSFTFGNLSVIKDMFTGLPKDVLAQIERDARFKAGSIEGADVEGAAAEAISSARWVGRRKAMMTMGLEMALLYAGNSVLQSAFNVMLGGKTLDQEGHDYIRNFRDMINEKQAHPLSMLQPFHTAESLSSTNSNEPNRRDRIYAGNAADGTAIYMRAPWGKIGEEFTNWFSSPIDMLKKKEGTVARPLMQILSNDAGFKREIYNPKAETWPDYVRSAAAIAKHLVLSQLPVGQFSAGMDLVRGEGDKLVNTLQLVGPLAGFTFSKGAPGGQAVGEMYDAKGQYQFAVDQALPDIRRQIRRGDIGGAMQRMDDLNIAPSLQRYYVKTTLDPALRMSPRATRDFYRYANPEQRDRFERAQQAPQPQQ